MASVPQGASTNYSATESNNNAIPLTIVTILFFMWGMITCLNDIIIPHLRSVYTLNYTQGMLVQFCFFGAYFVVSLPAGMLIKKIGYQRGAVTGLIIAACGCALFYPASTSGYALFLFAFFILAAGITILQVAANPYVTVLGPAQTASSRLNLTQAFNSLGTTIAPWLGGIFILGGALLTADQLGALNAAEQAAYRAEQAASVQGPYIGLAIALLSLAVFFALAKLPKIQHEDAPELSADVASNKESALSHRHLLLGTIGIFLYVGAEVAIGSLLINFFGEKNIAGLQEAEAAHFVSYYWGGAMIGRFIGFAVMRYISPGKTLAFNCLCAVILVLTATFTGGKLAMWAIIAVGLFNSIMFPTIFSMALHNLGKYTSQGSGFLCMAIVGGALVPLIQGALADTIGLQLSFMLPAACYLYIMYFGIKYASLHKSAPNTEPGHI